MDPRTRPGKGLGPESICLVLILVLGALLRLYHLGYECLWIDEAYSIADARRGAGSLFFGNLFHPRFSVNSAFYFALLNLWSFLGEGEMLLRLPSVFFGVASIYLAYLLGKKLFTTGAALSGAFFLAFSPFHILHSQEVRGYSLLVMLSLGALIFVTKAVREEKAGPAFIWIAVISGIAFHTHYISIVFIAGLAGYLAFAGLLGREKILTVRNFLPALFVFLIFTGKFLPRLLIGSFQRAVGEYGETHPFWLTRTFGSADLSYIPKVLQSFSVGVEGPPFSLLKPLWWIFPVLFLFGLYSAWKEKGAEKKLKFWLPAVMTFVPGAMLFAYSQFQNVFLPKYLVYVLPVFLITAAHGFSSIRNKYAQVFIGVMVVAILGGSLFSYYQGRRNPDWKNALNRVLLEYREGDVIAFNSGENRVVWEYYQRRLAEDKEVEVYYFGDYSAVDADVSKHIREISQEYKQLMALYRRIWLVSSLVWVSDPQNLVEQIAEAAFLREGAWPGNPKVALYQMSD